MSPTSRFLPLALVSALAFATPATMLLPSVSIAQDIGVSITVAPPVLPIYAQPIVPGDGYVWAPGYWAWGAYGYYWVPGTWVQPPQVGLLWTPGYWGWRGGGYFWHVGYWGPEVGFYGGINYGYGYNGEGYYGGRWDHDHFFYNRAVNNIGNVRITNVYNEPVRNVTVTRVAFNGGRGGISARPTQQQQAFASQHHVAPTSSQSLHEHAAAGNHALLASVNHGRPAIAATARPAAFTGPGVVHARGATAPAQATQPRPQAQRAAAPGSGAPNRPAARAAAPAGGGSRQSQAHAAGVGGPAGLRPTAPHPMRATGPARAPAAQHRAAIRPASVPHAVGPRPAPHAPPAVRRAAAPHPEAAAPAPAPHPEGAPGGDQRNHP
ncbi:MAG TPA: hypothetical protein VNF99_04990 [Stellaceae bacterium]|nr:hypothetical protein [Stellaceae bacterium]